MSTRGRPTTFVVPCFDEAERLAIGELTRLADDPDTAIVLVDDGSTDATPAVLRAFAAAHVNTRIATLPVNLGKAEAVRHGLRAARAEGATLVGYCDADFSTPASELLRLADVAAARSELAVVLGSRLALLGRSISRSAVRHAGGRVFAAGAARVLRLPVHDTQCGAKVMRGNATLDAALARPFRSRWAFDVELLGRLQALGVPASAMWEEPLGEWHDVRGSKRSLGDAVRATLELAPIALDLRRWSRR